MTKVLRYDLDFNYDMFADCHCDAGVDICKDGDYVEYTDYENLLAKYNDLLAIVEEK